MNKFFTFSLFVLIFLASCQPTSKQASSYNNTIIRQQRRVIVAMDDFFASLSVNDPKLIKNKYEKLQNAITTGIDTLNNLKAFDGSTEFRDKALELFEVYQQVANNELRTVVNILMKPASQYTTADAQIVSEQLYKAKNKVSSATEEFKKYQQQFAQKYGLVLIEN